MISLPIFTENMKFFAWTFLNSSKIGRWKSFNKSRHSKRGKKKKTWRGCFSQMFKKQISSHSSKQIFWHPLCLWKTPYSRFFFFFPLFACIDLLKLFHLPIFGELRKLHAKNFMFSVKIGREIIFQSWQLFDLFFTQCYNFPIVHWSACSTIDQPVQPLIRSYKHWSADQQTIGFKASNRR